MTKTTRRAMMTSVTGVVAGVVVGAAAPPNGRRGLPEEIVVAYREYREAAEAFVELDSDLNDKEERHWKSLTDADEEAYLASHARASTAEMRLYRLMGKHEVFTFEADGKLFVSSEGALKDSQCQIGHAVLMLSATLGL